MPSRLAVVAAVTLAVAALSVPASVAASAAPEPAAPRIPIAAPADYGTTTLGGTGWQVRSSADVRVDGAQISRSTFSTARWLRVRNDDGGAPGTEIEALLQNGGCPNVFYSDRMRRCFGEQVGRAEETVPRFKPPWWYRTTFATPPAGRRSTLVVNGVVGAADVWVNGTKVGTVQGAYTRYRFDVTRLLHAHTNAVAIAVHANDPSRMFTVDHVDWGQNPPDNNTGIQFPVQLQTSTALELSDAHVVQHDATDLSRADLTVAANVANHSSASRTGTVSALVTPPDGGRPLFVHRSVTVPGRNTAAVTLHATVTHPRVWWPYRMGNQPLYTVVTALDSGGELVDSTTQHLGIRTVSSALVGASPLAPGGVRRYTINGKPFVVRGGGFDPNLFLHYSAADTDHQIALLRSMGLNTIRLEGHFMPADFYDRMDRAGILVASGFQCCDAWELPTDTPLTPAQERVLSLSATAIAQRLRDHPSVFTFQWSDNAPTPKQEALTLTAFRAEDFDVPTIASAEYKSSPQLGLAGEKEGPYDWVPPNYWYDRAHSDHADDPSLTNVGGSWALDSEQSAGHTVPTRDSMDRFLSPADQAKLWQDPKANQYHANPETGTSGYAFGTLYNFDTALLARYGSWSNLDGYVAEAQLQNYEDVRAQFEAFIDHSTESSAPSTGTIYWMANKGWPTLLWDLYNYDYDEAGSYFGAQEANRALHALYAPSDRTVTVDNLTGSTARGLRAQVKVYAVDGSLLDDRTSAGFDLDAQQVRNRVLAPTVPRQTVPPQRAHTYFVEVLLRRGAQVIDRDVYWESTQSDRTRWSKTEGEPQATMTRYADLTELRGLAPAAVRVTASTVRPGRTTVTITNSGGGVAMLLRADVRRRGVTGDDQVRPVTWSANDVTLWPGESETLTARYAPADLHGAAPVVSRNGWNLAARTVPAG